MRSRYLTVFSIFVLLFGLSACGSFSTGVDAPVPNCQEPFVDFGGVCLNNTNGNGDGDNVNESNNGNNGDGKGPSNVNDAGPTDAPAPTHV